VVEDEEAAGTRRRAEGPGRVDIGVPPADGVESDGGDIVVVCCPIGVTVDGGVLDTAAVGVVVVAVGVA